MKQRPSFRHGRIVWAYLRSNQTGKREKHPAVILNQDDDIVQPEVFDPRKATSDNIVYVIGLSTKHKRYGLAHIRLPFTPQGHGTTKLKEDCGAIIGWYDRVCIPDDVLGFGGDVPPAVLAQIDGAVRQDLAKLLGKQFQTVQQMLEELLGEQS